MAPSAFVQMKEWKLTPNGKIDRNRLPTPEESSEDAETEFIAPRTPVEEKLAEIWSNLLRRERIGITDNFFDLGGHSLLATQIVSRIRDAFGDSITLRMLFETPTIAGLADQIIGSDDTVRKTNGHEINHNDLLSSEELSAKVDEMLQDEELELLLAQLENASDDEVQQLLAKEFNSVLVLSGD